MERAAFSRARAFLSYSPKAKWLALIAGGVNGAFYVLLVLLLALFIDLLVSRGRVPNLAQLSLAEQEQFIDAWQALPQEARVEAIDAVLGANQAKEAGTSRRALRNALTATDDLPPVPAKMTADDLVKWAQGRPVQNESPYIVAMREQELRWRAYVWHYLKDHVGPEAANSFQPVNVPAPVPGLGEENHTTHGVLGLVVRLRSSLAGKAIASVASFNSWMWENTPNRDANRSYLTGLLCLAVATAMLAAICVIVMKLAAARATLEAVTRLRRAVYHHALRLGDLSPRAHGTPNAQALFTRHVESVHEALYLWLTTISRYPAQIVLLLGLALIVQPWLALATVLFGLLIWMLGGRIVAAFRRQGRALAKFATTRLVLMYESIKLMRLVKSYMMDFYNQSRVERQLAEYSKAHWLRYKGEALARPVLMLLVGMGGITLLYLSGRIVLADELSLAGLTILVVSVSGVYPPVKGWLDLNKYLRRGRDAAAGLFEFLDRKTDRAMFSDGEFLQPMTRSIEFKDVALREPGENGQLLADINFVVRAGEKIGIMGADDDAKKAFISLLSRFVDPTDGEIRIDDLNLKWVTLESLRAQIGLVTQNNLIFNDSVANNIGCGEPGITLPRIIEAAKLAHAHQFIQKLPYGYETPIGEMGHSLRIGEQFRIALARAIVRDPAIFIIEEPPSALDDDTKALLDDTFNRILPGKTVIFLPHRISTLRHCDRIVLLNNGTIEAVGDHRELVHKSSLYKHLYYVEFNAFADQT